MFVRKSILTMVLAASGVSAVWAQPSVGNGSREVSFAPIGVALTETLQVNLFNQSASGGSGTAPSCTGSVAFLDSTGKAIAGTGGNFTVGAGATQSISILGSKANSSSTTGSRAEIRATITLNSVRGTPCSLVDSLETFDSTTGATHVYVLGSILNQVPFPISF
jgi:hypothetical protein